MAKARSKYSGPINGLGSTMVELAPGVWVTSGRAVAVSGEDELCLIDADGEPMVPPRARLARSKRPRAVWPVKRPFVFVLLTACTGDQNG
jgi:hypothetical protein